MMELLHAATFALTGAPMLVREIFLRARLVNQYSMH